MPQEFKLEVTEDLLVYIERGDASIPNASPNILKEGDKGSSEEMLAILGIKEGGDWQYPPNWIMVTEISNKEVQNYKESTTCTGKSTDW